MKRRQFISLLGGGVILAAGTTLGVVATRKPTLALQPWRDAPSLYSEPRKKALSYAILAPNPHNQQPWIVDLSVPDQVALYVNPDKLLPHTDPFNRQITIGLGCFLENLSMAAAQDGYRVSFDLFPEGEEAAALDDRPVAIASFVADNTVAKDPLFTHILERRSSKVPYDLARPVSSDALAEIVAAAGNGVETRADGDAELVQSLRRLTTDALTIELETPRTLKESVDVFRIGKTEVEANPDGLSFTGPMFETLGFLGVFTRESSLNTESSLFGQAVAAGHANTESAMAYVWQVTQTNTRVDQINTGRDWVRVNLAATKLGVAMQPLSQALQEYPEMTPYYDEAHQMLAPKGGTVQMLARLGYSDPIPPSPRWPLEVKIKA